MKVILEHVKSSTVPHDLIPEFVDAGVKFYEGRRHSYDEGLSMLTPHTRVPNYTNP